MRGAAWRMLLLVCWLGALSSLAAQIEFHGNVYPLARLTFENRYLDLPHRIAAIEGYSRGRSAGLFFSTALEHRLSSNEAVLGLREAYVEFSSGSGDFRLGKQIIAWGTADGNNPTDNVNPYDFYYLFLPGTDRKVGNVMAVARLYLGAVNLEAVVTPVFQPNRIPVNEPDFPIFGDVPFTMDLTKADYPDRGLGNTEMGVRALLPLSMMDVSLSYFRGFDRMFTPVFNELFPGTGIPDPTSLKSLEYYQTQVIGGELVTFLGDWAIRAEAAYFLTEDKDGDDPSIRNPYLQYVLQLDRMADNSNLVVQLLGDYVTKLDGDDIVYSGVVFTEEENERDNIPPKLGMPFGAIARNAVLATTSRDFADGRYSLQGQVLYDLDHKGYMVGGSLTMTLEDAFDLEVGLTYLGGDEESRLSTIGEAFSHVYVGMKYSF